MGTQRAAEGGGGRGDTGENGGMPPMYNKVEYLKSLDHTRNPL